MSEIGMHYKTTTLGDTPVTATTPMPTSVTTFGGAANIATGQVTGTTAGTTAIVAARSTRRSVTIKNISSANSIFIGDATVTTLSGIPLNAGESIALDFTGALAGYAMGGACVVAYADVYGS